jgi:hypothetical protein
MRLIVRSKPLPKNTVPSGATLASICTEQSSLHAASMNSSP